jgi:PQQ-dependent catabolism-associated CXXCW motif protein
MVGPHRSIVVGLAVLVALHVPVSYAQRSLAQLQKELIAPWLVTVQGEDRDRLLRINEIAQESEGSYLVSATYGWADGVQQPVRIEMIRSSQELRLIFRSTAGDNVYSFRQLPSGDFTGTVKPTRGAEKPARLEKLAEDQVGQKAQETSRRVAARVFADEDKDWGVAPTKSPRTGRMHAPTPKELPGAKTIRTMELRAMQGHSPAPVLIDVLGGDGHRTIPGARWLKGAGEGALDKLKIDQLRVDLEKITGGRETAPIVFFCLSSECWLSYNAGLRAIEMGYTNVHWYRGGTEAWNRAGFETQEAEPYRR